MNFLNAFFGIELNPVFLNQKLFVNSFDLFLEVQFLVSLFSVAASLGKLMHIVESQVKDKVRFWKSLFGFYSPLVVDSFGGSIGDSWVRVPVQDQGDSLAEFLINRLLHFPSVDNEDQMDHSVLAVDFGLEELINVPSEHCRSLRETNQLSIHSLGNQRVHKHFRLRRFPRSVDSLKSNQQPTHYLINNLF